MSLLRLNGITTRVLTQGRLVSNVEPAVRVRWIASNNGKKSTSNPGMVNDNNNNQRIKRQNPTEDEPALTIYPLDKLDFSKKPRIELKNENVVKNTKNTANTVINSNSKNKNQKSPHKNEPKKKGEKPTTISHQVINEMPKPECLTSSKSRDKKVLCKIPESIPKSQPKIVFTSPIIRECQTKSGSSEPSTPPPADSSSSVKSHTLLFGAITALLIGGGTYVILKSRGEENNKPSEASQNTLIQEKLKVPSTSAEIPKEVPYLLIGGGTASFAAFRAIKSHEPKAKIMVLSNETETPYMRPPLSKELWLAESARIKAASKEDSESLKFKQWNGVERSLYYEPNDFYIHPSKLSDEPNGGVAIVRGYTVKKIDVQNRIAFLTDGTEIKYDKCLIATGSRPKTLPEFENVSSNIKQRVSLFRTIEDYSNLKRNVDNSKSVAIIGGGFLGSELACALAKYGEDRKLEVHQIFHEAGNMGKVLPEFLSKWTTERVREENVNIVPNTYVQGVELVNNNQLKLKLQNGAAVVCDHAIVAVGSEPNVDIAAESFLEIDNVHGGYLVNAELEARNNLYVAGDAACFYDPRLGRRRVEHHDHAVVSGRLAGENMVGLHKPYTHQSMFWSDLGPKVGYEAIGITDSTLPTVSVFVKPEPVKAKPKEESLAIKTDSITPSVQAAATNDDQVPNDFSKGIVFYLRDEKIVGIVLWNVFNRINTARAVVFQNKKYDDLNEVAKLFDIHA